MGSTVIDRKAKWARGSIPNQIASEFGFAKAYQVRYAKPKAERENAWDCENILYLLCHNGEIYVVPSYGYGFREIWFRDPSEISQFAGCPPPKWDRWKFIER